MSRVFSIVNQKGGVGKTTTAVNLAAGLAIEGNAVLLVDMDPQASATSGLGIRLESGDASAYDVLLGSADVEQALRKTMLPGLQVLPASRDLVGAEIELVALDRREMRLKEAIAEIRKRYDFVVIDCPPSLGLVTLNALAASDSLLIPLQCEYYALEGLSALLETIDLIRDRLNPHLEIEGLLLTMFDGRNLLS
ncbi:ParA family protein, partial [bacterium]|nr:ParA family protein [bacterium]